MKVKRQIWNLCRVIGTADTYKELEQRYEKLTNLVLSWGGRIHGSQHSSNVVGTLPFQTIVVYFEVPIDSLDKFLEEEAKLS